MDIIDLDVSKTSSSFGEITDLFLFSLLEKPCHILLNE